MKDSNVAMCALLWEGLGLYATLRDNQLIYNHIKYIVIQYSSSHNPLAEPPGRYHPGTRIKQSIRLPASLLHGMD